MLSQRPHGKSPHTRGAVKAGRGGGERTPECARDQGRKCEQAEQADAGRHALSVTGVEPALGTQAPQRAGRPAGTPEPSAHSAPPGAM